MAQLKFTFKTERSTGKWRSFHPDTYKIKLKGLECGSISEHSSIGLSNNPERNGLFEISFSIKREKTEQNPAPFRNVTLKRTFTTVDEAKEFLVEGTERLTKEFDLYCFPKE